MNFKVALRKLSSLFQDHSQLLSLTHCHSTMRMTEWYGSNYIHCFLFCMFQWCLVLSVSSAQRPPWWPDQKNCPRKSWITYWESHSPPPLQMQHHHLDQQYRGWWWWRCPWPSFKSKTDNFTSVETVAREEHCMRFDESEKKYWMKMMNQQDFLNGINR